MFVNRLNHLAVNKTQQPKNENEDKDGRNTSATKLPCCRTGENSS